MYIGSNGAQRGSCGRCHEDVERGEWVWMSIWVYRFRLRQCSTSAAVKSMGRNGRDMRTWRGEPACNEHSALALQVLVELPVKSSIMVWLEWKIQRFTLLNRRSKRGKGVASHLKKREREYIRGKWRATYVCWAFSAICFQLFSQVAMSNRFYIIIQLFLFLL